MTKPRQPRYADIFRGNEAQELKAKEVWKDTVAWLVENDILTPGRVGIADRYARACAEYETLHAEAMVDGPVKIGGTNGGEYFNYKWSAVEKLNDRMAKFEDALLLSPKAAQDKIADKASPSAKTKADGYLD